MTSNAMVVSRTLARGEAFANKRTAPAYVTRAMLATIVSSCVGALPQAKFAMGTESVMKGPRDEACANAHQNTLGMHVICSVVVLPMVDATYPENAHA